jgi:hypothetical protein
LVANASGQAGESNRQTYQPIQRFQFLRVRLLNCISVIN